jgi:perosamine synthetase
MTTGEGGMVTTDDALIAERVRLLRSHGQKERYHHTALGYNQRMTEMQAAIGLVQIEKLERFTERRIANAMFLTEGLGRSVQTPLARPGYRHVYHQYTIRVPDNQDRDGWAKKLQARGIGTGVHYPLAIHQQPFYQEHRDKFRCVRSSEHKELDRELPVAETAAEQVLSLPVHPALSEDDLATVVREVRALCS